MSTRLCREWVASSKVSRYGRVNRHHLIRPRGRMDCFGADGPLTASRIVPDFLCYILGSIDPGHRGVVSGLRC